MDKHSNKPLLLGDILPDVLKEMGMDKRHEIRISEAWRAMFGEAISKYTGKLCIREGILYLQITSAVLRQDLFMQREQIIAKLNEAVGENILYDIIFL